MCEAVAITFDEGAMFVAASEVTASEVARIHRAARFVTGNAVLPEPVDGALFQQITDSVTLNLFKTYSGLDVGGPQEMTPEMLVESGFSEQAVINGLGAARVLSNK